jgi:radical SAM protein with 4Fe4S-binding SPASM domain
MAGLKKLQNANIPVHFLAVLSRKTSSEIPEFFELAKKFNVPGMSFTRLISVGFAKKLTADGEDAPLKPMELKEAYTKILRESARTGVQTNLRAPLFRLLDRRLGANGLFGEGIVIDHQGNMVASSRSRIVLGHAIDDGLENIFFKNPIYQALRNGNIEICGKCRFYSTCGGDRNAAFAESGNYLGADPGCWLKTNAI